MTEHTTDTAPESPENGTETGAQGTEGTGETEPDTFPRAVVEDLRKENATYRDKAKRADDYGQRLHTALVAATGRLADPSDLVFDAAHLDDETALTAAVDDLLAAKPHLASRRPAGDIGQGATAATDSVDLAGILRARAS